MKTTETILEIFYDISDIIKCMQNNTGLHDITMKHKGARVKPVFECKDFDIYEAIKIEYGNIILTATRRNLMRVNL